MPVWMLIQISKENWYVVQLSSNQAISAGCNPGWVANLLTASEQVRKSSGNIVLWVVLKGDTKRILKIPQQAFIPHRQAVS